MLTMWTHLCQFICILFPLDDLIRSGTLSSFPSPFPFSPLPPVMFVFVLALYLVSGIGLGIYIGIVHRCVAFLLLQAKTKMAKAP